MKILLLECQLDWYSRYLCINKRVSETYRAWLSDLRIQIRMPRLPGATGLNPVNQPLPLSEADKTGSKSQLFVRGRVEVSQWHPFFPDIRLFCVSYEIVQLCICHNSGTQTKVSGGPTNSRSQEDIWNFKILSLILLTHVSLKELRIG